MTSQSPLDDPAIRSALLVGPPRSGKTTALERLRDRLANLSLAGVVCPEVRAAGDRAGFDIVDVASGERAPLARRDREEGPRVGSYRVDVAALNRIAAAAFGRCDRADAVLVDEVAPMQRHGDAFVTGLRAALDDSTPTVACVGATHSFPLVEAVRARVDATAFPVTPATRDDLPARIERFVCRRC